MSTCKYCGDPIPDGYYCCEFCWSMFEEPREDEDDYEEGECEDEEE